MAPFPAPGQYSQSPQELAALLQKEYDLVNGNFRQLSEIRFKLLSLVPAVVGVANFALTKVALAESSADNNWLVLLFGAVGFFATLGIAMYDQRNSELYGELIRRAKYLERCLSLPHSTKANEYGGQFRERPTRGRRMLGVLLMGHDNGLALIYGPVLGLWFLPIIYSALALARTYGRLPQWASNGSSTKIAVVGAALVTVVFIVDFLQLDGTWRRLWRKLWPR